MDRRLIAVVPTEGDLLLIREGLRQVCEVVATENLWGALLHQVASQEHPVVLYDTEAGDHWRSAVGHLLAVRRDLRVVVLSREANERLWIDILDAGAFDLLMKPFAAQELRHVVHSAFQHRHEDHGFSAVA